MGTPTAASKAIVWPSTVTEGEVWVRGSVMGGRVSRSTRFLGPGRSGRSLAHLHLRQPLELVLFSVSQRTHRIGFFTHISNCTSHIPILTLLTPHSPRTMATTTMSMRAVAAAVASPAASSNAHKLGARAMVSTFHGVRTLNMSAAIAPGSSHLYCIPDAKRPLRAAMGVRAMGSSNGASTPSGLPIDLRGKRAFIAGVADDQGFGWAIAKALAAAGAEILVGTWVPALNIFESSLRRGKFDESRKLPNGGLLEITKVYPLDAVFDTLEDVPEDIKSNKRYSGSSAWTVQECAEAVKADFGTIDILVHSLANGPEVTKPLMETTRKGYLAAISASTYSYVSLLKYFAPIMNPGGSSLSLTYLASEKIIPGYGGGMSSAKAALESDTRVLAFEVGRKYGIRVNTISAGPLRSRAAKAIGFIDDMINYSTANAPLQKELEAADVGHTAAFLSSPLASAVTGTLIYVDNGLHAMGLAVDSPSVSKAAAPAPEKTNVAA